MERIDSLQLLRGIAATLVAAFHLWAAAVAAAPDGQAPWPLGWVQGGEAGVDLFFVLSGFIIAYVSATRIGDGPVAFLRARFWRIYPPYWAVLGLMWLIGLAAWLGLGDGGMLPDGPGQILTSVLLLPLPGHSLRVAWTLAVEVLFYLVFALSYYRFGLRGVILALLVWAGAAQAMAAGMFTLPGAAFVLHSVVAEFLYGVLIAKAYLTRAALPLTRPALILGTVALAAHVAGFYDAGDLPGGREIAAGLPAAAVVYGLLGVRARMPGWILLWGESSYLLYLAHLPIFTLLGQMALRGMGKDVYTSLPAMAGMLALSMALCAFATRFLERPYHRWYKAHMLARTQAPARPHSQPSGPKT